MGNFFSQDSKLIQALTFLGDLIILNVLFLLCSAPVVTIGAAQAGLYTGMRALLDKEAGGSCQRAFFRGLTAGFGRITAAWCLSLPLVILPGGSLVTLLFYTRAPGLGAVIVSAAALFLCALYQTVLPPFHARFGCSIGQLLRNGLFFLLAYPLRCLLVAVVLWLPALVLLLSVEIFMRITPLWIFIYFSLAVLLAGIVFKKPFMGIARRFADTGEDA